MAANHSHDYFSAVNHSYSYGFFSAYATCVRYVRDTRRNHCPYDPNDMPSRVFISLGLMGAANNFMSLLVFSHPKYEKRLISRLLRYLYVSNIIASSVFSINLLIYYILPPFSNPPKRIFTLMGPVAIKTSYGILAYMAVLKCINYKYPLFIAFSNKAKTLSWLVIMFLVACSAGFHVKRLFVKYDLLVADDVLLVSFYYFLAMLIVVGFNSLWFALTFMQTSARQLSISASVFERRLFESSNVSKSFYYACISSMMFLATTPPATIYTALPPPSTDWKPTCQECNYMICIADWLWPFLYCGVFFDNTIYYIRSEQYRRELKTALTKKTRFIRRYKNSASPLFDSLRSTFKRSPNSRPRV